LTSTNVFSLEVDFNDVILAGTVNGIFRSTNNGDFWTQIYNLSSGNWIGAIAVNTEGDIFAGGYGMVRSTDNGINWIEINNGLTDLNIQDIAISSSNFVYVGTFAGSIFRSTDNGVNWIQINNGLNTPIVFSLSINSLNHIFVGTFDGVFRSTDNGNNWALINDGLTNSGILSSTINSDDYIFVGSDGNGVFRSINPTTSVENEISKIPSEYLLSQNYPNPFNPTTTITYQIPEREFVTLKVYDILGREIATLVNEEKPAGSYEVEFNSHSGEVRNLTSGIYFYQIKAGEYSETKKMILLQ